MVSPGMQKSQYLKILYEHSLEYSLILFKRAFQWLSWTIDRTRERKRRKGLGRRLLHSRQTLVQTQWPQTVLPLMEVPWRGVTLHWPPQGQSSHPTSVTAPSSDVALIQPHLKDPAPSVPQLGSAGRAGGCSTAKQDPAADFSGA